MKVLVRNENKFGQNLKLKEKELVAKLRELNDVPIPRNGELDKLLSILTSNRMKILHAVQKHGIALWIWCPSQSALETLRQMSESSELVAFLSKLFIHLLPNGVVVPKTVIVHKEQFHDNKAFGKPVSVWFHF